MALSRRTIVRAGSWGCIPALLALWIGIEYLAVRAVRPPPGANLTAFMDEGSDIAGIRQFRRNGQVYFAVLGRVPIFGLNLPSGPPAYVFDETGALVDWTTEVDDAPAFVEKWGRSNFSLSDTLTHDEIERALKAAG